jgi:hypothetical protein
MASINVTIDAERAAILKRAFPEKKDLDDVAKRIAQMVTNEFIDLLGGRKRYISLSHQYIEWLEDLYETVLPEEEYTYRRLLDKFNFPPGTAAYVSRVLRQRQNTTLHERARAGLKKKLAKQLDEYEKYASDKDKAVSEKLRSVELTVREYDLLQSVMDQLFSAGISIGFPKVTFRTREFVTAEYNVDHIKKVLPEIDNL